MNANRRKAIEKVLSQIEELKSELEELKDEEQEYYDNMPESFQNGEKGDMATTCIEALENALNSIEEAIDYANETL